MALILSGIRNRRIARKTTTLNLSGYGQATIKQISAQAKQATAKSQQVIGTAKKIVSTTKAVSGQLTQALNKLKSGSLSGFSGYGNTSILKSQLAEKKKALAETKQIIATAKQTIKSTKSIK